MLSGNVGDALDLMLRRVAAVVKHLSRTDVDIEGRPLPTRDPLSLFSSALGTTVTVVFLGACLVCVGPKTPQARYKKDGFPSSFNPYKIHPPPSSESESES